MDPEEKFGALRRSIEAAFLVESPRFPDILLTFSNSLGFTILLPRTSLSSVNFGKKLVKHWLKTMEYTRANACNQ